MSSTPGHLVGSYGKTSLLARFVSTIRPMKRRGYMSPFRRFAD
jgi:hypothetical protein